MRYDEMEKEIQEKIKMKKLELKKLYKEAEKFKKHSELSYEQCAKIADRLNTFHFLKDIDKKKKLFFNKIIYIAQKSRHKTYNYEEMTKFLDEVENVLRLYKGMILYKEAREEFMVKYFSAIVKNGIEKLIYMDNEIKFQPYTGEINYISKII